MVKGVSIDIMSVMVITIVLMVVMNGIGTVVCIKLMHILQNQIFKGVGLMRISQMKLVSLDLRQKLSVRKTQSRSLAL